MRRLAAAFQPATISEKMCAAALALAHPLLPLPVVQRLLYLPGAPHAALACGGFESSLEPSFRHDAVKPNTTSIQIRLRISRISSSSLKQLWVGAGGRALIPKDAFGWWVAYPRVLGKHHRSEFVEFSYGRNLQRPKYR